MSTDRRLDKFLNVSLALRSHGCYRHEAGRIRRSRNDRERLSHKLQRLPLFPLYRVLLFPRALLPLYIFEPRYREMTAECLAGNGLLAIAQLTPGF